MYTHKRCSNIARCRLCSGPHKSVECQERRPTCYHYKGDYYPLSKECPKQKEEACKIQHEEKVNRSLVRPNYMARREGKSYAAQVKCVKTVKEVKRMSIDREEREKQINMKKRVSEEESKQGKKRRR